jgi:23S rRNA pseudouridine1911/1915/1917 synthase
VSSEPGGPAANPPPSLLTVTPAHRGLRADAFLAIALPFLSRTRVRQKIQTGESLLNGRRYATSARLAAGDVLTVSWRSAPPSRSTRQFHVLFQDEHIIAVDKPAGAASHPAGRFQSDTVIQFVRELLAAETRASLSQDGDFFPRLVNRLDVFTSGVILAATTGLALREMQSLAACGKINKRYVALVEGVVAGEHGMIDLPLGPDSKSSTNLRMAPREDGLASVTDFVVLRRLPAHTLLAVFPRTGRQHQIRAHLAAAGHPVCGDLLYKDESLFLRYQRAGGVPDPSLPLRHCLHAEEVEFLQPFTGRRILIRSALPSDFLDILHDVKSPA